MKETLRDMVIGIGALCLTTATISGRLRSAVRHKLANDVPGVRMSTKVEPSGVFGPLVGRFARLTVDADGLAPDRFALGQAERRPAMPGRVRLAFVRSRNVPVAGIRAERAVLVIGDVVTDAVGLVGGGDLSVWRSGQGRAAVVIDAEAIEKYAAEHLTTLSNVSVILNDDALVATGCMSGTSPPQPVVLRAKLKTTEDALLIAEPEVWLGGRRAPDAMAKIMVLAAGPIMRLREAGGVTSRFRLQDVHVGEGQVILSLAMPPFSGTTGR